MEAVEWLSCMKCVGGAMHKQTMSHLKKHTGSHNAGFSCYRERDAQTNRRQKKKKEREESQQPALLLMGLLCPP